VEAAAQTTGNTRTADKISDRFTFSAFFNYMIRGGAPLELVYSRASFQASANFCGLTASPKANSQKMTAYLFN
jgi:hypothetical protein